MNGTYFKHTYYLLHVWLKFLLFKCLMDKFFKYKSITTCLYLIFTENITRNICQIFGKEGVIKNNKDKRKQNFNLLKGGVLSVSVYSLEFRSP